MSKNTIQLSRGSLKVRENLKQLLDGELHLNSSFSTEEITALQPFDQKPFTTLHTKTENNIIKIASENSLVIREISVNSRKEFWDEDDEINPYKFPLCENTIFKVNYNNSSLQENEYVAYSYKGEWKFDLFEKINIDNVDAYYKFNITTTDYFIDTLKDGDLKRSWLCSYLNPEMIYGNIINILNKSLTNINTKIGSLDSLSTTEKNSIVDSINEVFEKSHSSGDATYFVDSDQSLLDWATNVEGNDYSVVFIKKGEWTSTVGVNLTTAGTKVVVGEVGSKLIFSVVEKGISGLFYDTVPTTPDYWMRDVTVECYDSKPSFKIGYGYCFYNCTNLTKCTGYASGVATGSDTSTAYGYGFYSCTNLTRCTSSGSGTAYGPSGTAYGYGFYNCTNLTSCTGSGVVISASTVYGDGYGFYNCITLNSCVGFGSGGGKGYGYGFYECKGVSSCKEAYMPCQTALFKDCYASLVEDERFLCNGTVDGGFNGDDVSSYGSVGNIQDLTTTDKSSVVAAINEINNNASSGGGSSGLYSIVPTFTYEVNSDQSLLDWANNVSGNDYSAVLIRRGTWTSTKGVNLTAAGTKVVQGESGSKLVFNEVEIGLFYNTTPMTTDYWMRDITAEFNRTGNNTGFNGCTNLTNCIGTSSSLSNGFSIVKCFDMCTNLINCNGTGNISTGSGLAYGFINCTSLTFCSGTGIKSTGSGFGYGFSMCNNVSYCKKYSKCTTSVFNSCYASFSTTSTYTCADTPEGGFNDPTN